MPADNSVMIHAQAINLARRLSVQNENDLMQEDMFDNTLDSHVKYDREHCAQLASHLTHLKYLPKECRKFQDITMDLKRRDSDTTHGSEVLS